MSEYDALFLINQFPQVRPVWITHLTAFYCCWAKVLKSTGVKSRCREAFCLARESTAGKSGDHDSSGEVDVQSATEAVGKSHASCATGNMKRYSGRVFLHR